MWIYSKLDFKFKHLWRRTLFCHEKILPSSTNSTILIYLSLSFFLPCVSLCVHTERPPEGSGWGRLELAAVILVPSCLLCVGILMGVCVMQGQRCAHYRGRQQDVEDPLDEQSIMSPEKCLKELIFDMSTSGSGSGEGLSWDRVGRTPLRPLACRGFVMWASGLEAFFDDGNNTIWSANWA